MRIIFNIKDANKLEFSLKRGDMVIAEEMLTIDREFGNMLITSLDKLLGSIKMDSTCVKSAEILGKVDENALWGMILKSVSHALRS